ncbi:dynein light chain LC8-type [Nematocida parisii]|nr:dynein light chain LC8-type [Nematocida parisii]KAI5157189.1 dynein light chain LC8-type [Nematocida parisii]
METGKSAEKSQKGEKAKDSEDILMDMKIVVNNKDISENIQADVADMCLSFKDFKNPADHAKLAAKIKKSLDSKYTKGWNVIVGESFTGSCSIAKNHFLEISIANIRVLVFKSNA